MQEYLSKYAACMEEIKMRTAAITDFCNTPSSAKPKRVIAECIALQIRKILELIALSSLVANKEIYSGKYTNFQKAWRAKDILKKIEAINANFYPVPGRQILDQSTGKVVSVECLQHGFLTRDEFENIYDRCSVLLHAENPFATSKDIENFIRAIPIWMKKIMSLLNHHQIQLPNVDFQFWTIMNSKNDGSVQVTLFRRVED